LLESRIKTYQNVLQIVDICACTWSFWFGLYFTSAFPMSRSVEGYFYINIYLSAACAFSLFFIYLTHIASFWIFEFRKTTSYASNISLRAISLLATLVLDCGLIVLFLILFKAPYLSSTFYMCYVSIAFPSILLTKALAHSLPQLIFSPTERGSVNLLIIGSNEDAYHFFTFLQRNAFLGYRVVGFLDDENRCRRPIPIIGKLDDFVTIIKDRIVDRCVLFMSLRSQADKIVKILDVAESQGAPVQLMSNIFESRYKYSSPFTVGAFSGLLFDVTPTEPWWLLSKRAFDIAVSLTALLCSAPILLLAMLAILLDDGWPVVFTQKRIGFRKRPFILYKLRTMRSDAETMQERVEHLNEMDGPVFKIKSDPRITRIGKLLRKYGVDELPQLFNVLTGAMSIVGPRPLAKRDFDCLPEKWLRRRFSVRPGLTCLWQIKNNRNDVPFEEWMKLDIQYVDAWSFFEDVKICVKTIPAILSGTGR
jgi:exopolysaccharide biosynthesis polyprenyl glycosylphosphotransferase